MTGHVPHSLMHSKFASGVVDGSTFENIEIKRKQKYHLRVTALEVWSCSI